MKEIILAKIEFRNTCYEIIDKLERELSKETPTRNYRLIIFTAEMIREEIDKIPISESY